MCRVSNKWPEEEAKRDNFETGSGGDAKACRAATADAVIKPAALLGIPGGTAKISFLSCIKTPPAAHNVAGGVFHLYNNRPAGRQDDERKTL